MRRTLLLSVVAALAFAAPAPAAPAAPALGPDQLTLVREQRLSPRLLELTFRTPAVSGETGVRVLLPAGYDAEPATARHPRCSCCTGRSTTTPPGRSRATPRRSPRART